MALLFKDEHAMHNLKTFKGLVKESPELKGKFDEMLNVTLKEKIMKGVDLNGLDNGGVNYKQLQDNLNDPDFIADLKGILPPEVVENIEAVKGFVDRYGETFQTLQNNMPQGNDVAQGMGAKIKEFLELMFKAPKYAIETVGGQISKLPYDKAMKVAGSQKRMYWFDERLRLGDAVKEFDAIAASSMTDAAKREAFNETLSGVTSRVKNLTGKVEKAAVKVKAGFGRLNRMRGGHLTPFKPKDLPELSVYTRARSGYYRDMGKVNTADEAGLKVIEDKGVKFYTDMGGLPEDIAKKVTRLDTRITISQNILDGMPHRSSTIDYPLTDNINKLRSEKAKLMRDGGFVSKSDLNPGIDVGSHMMRLLDTKPDMKLSGPQLHGWLKNQGVSFRELSMADLDDPTVRTLSEWKAYHTAPNGRVGTIPTIQRGNSGYSEYSYKAQGQAPSSNYEEIALKGISDTATHAVAGGKEGMNLGWRRQHTTTINGEAGIMVNEIQSDSIQRAAANNATKPTSEKKFQIGQMASAINDAIKDGSNTVFIPIEREGALAGNAAVTKKYMKLNNPKGPIQTLKKNLEAQGYKLDVEKILDNQVSGEPLWRLKVTPNAKVRKPKIDLIGLGAGAAGIGAALHSNQQNRKDK